MYQTLPDILPAQSSVLQNDIRLNDRHFSPNYSTHAPASLQPWQRVWQVKWLYLETAELKELDEFFTAHQGNIPFYWAPPHLPASGLYNCSSWQVIPQSDAHTHLYARLVLAS